MKAKYKSKQCQLIKSALSDFLDLKEGQNIAYCRFSNAH